MQKPVVVIGIGELGSVFARGFLKLGHPVYPILRRMHLASSAERIPAPEVVLVTVAKDDLHPLLKNIPDLWRDRLALLQNELLPRDWLAHALPQPTVIIVRFEKKRGSVVKVGLESTVYGPQAELIESVFAALDLPVRRLKDAEELLFELVSKNLYILTINIAGLVVGGTVGELWGQHQDLAREVAQDVLDIQTWLTGIELPRERLVQSMSEAFEAVPDQRCLGRVAQLRLEKAIQQAEEAGLEVPRLRKIQAGMDG
jgi:ketopantoate reductase